MSLSCYYDYFAIQNAANSINELEINEPISCQPAYSGTYTLDKIKDLSSSDYSTNILNISDRIKVYLDCVQSHLSSSSDIESVLSSFSIDLASRPLDIYIQDGTFSTKSTSDTTYNNWVRLTAFWADAYRNFIVPKSHTKSEETNLQTKTSYLFNSQTAFDTSTYSHAVKTHVDSSIAKTASSVAYMSDIQAELRSFMKTLSEIKLFQMNFRRKQTNITTELIASTAKPSKNCCCCSCKKSNLAEISQGPYKVIPQSLGYSWLPVIQNDKVLDQNILNLELLVKLNDSRAEMPRSFPITDEGSNGVMSYYTDIQETEFDLLSKADEIERMFDLQAGSIISRKNVLNAIDYIFFLWATNISQLVYNCEMCHTNCHANTAEPHIIIDDVPAQYDYSYETSVTLGIFSGTQMPSATICYCNVKSGTATPSDSGAFNVKLQAKVTGYKGHVKGATVNGSAIGTSDTTVSWSPPNNIPVAASYTGQFAVSIKIKVTWSEMKG